jgi:hypothetical protein
VRLSAGTRLGSYEIVGPIGAGGMREHETRAVARSVRSFTHSEVISMANIECPVGTAEDVNPRHADDDAIVV